MNIKLFLLLTIFANSIYVQQAKSQEIKTDIDKNSCIRSASYVWSDIKRDCIRAFELQNQLINKDNTPYASILFSTSMDSVEVFSSEGQFILTKKKKNYFIGNQNETSFFMEKNNSKWVMGKLESDEILYREK